MRWLSALGASALVGAAAAVLWAPVSGPAARVRLAAGLGGWWRAVAARASSAMPRRPGAGRPRPAAPGGPNLAMQPNRLLTES